MVRTRHVSGSRDFSSLTSFAAHSRASCIFPASLKARAFARAWLIADRLVADSFPERASRALRVTADYAARCYLSNWPKSFSAATNLGAQYCDRNVYVSQPVCRVAVEDASRDQGQNRHDSASREVAAPGEGRVAARLAYAEINDPDLDLAAHRGRLSNLCWAQR